jgi:thiamine-phosphate diphosphorylase
MPLNPSPSHAIMCLTLDGLGLSPLEQVDRLLEAGATFLQLRMKGAPAALWTETARLAVRRARARGALLIVNDSVDVALAAEADGVHLGKNDESWASARKRLGPGRILGGTVNNEGEARMAAECGVLDYVGIGPFRFTQTKQLLAPVLGKEGIAALLPVLGGLPAWAIGGIEPEDAASLRESGLAGIAVSSGLYRDGATEQAFHRYLAAWSSTAVPLFP